MKNIIQNFEKTQINKNIPFLSTGNYVKVKLWILDEKKKRIQTFEGVIIAIKNRGLNSSFTVRKIINNEGVERVFQTHSKIINEIIIIRKGIIRKSKLYYLRNIKTKNTYAFEK
ncbi:50S ribosomal protein L19 [Enterobacterales bacterium endosymbiont of Anomoneura mori]|uniref:50S ribosomal protein L19 n=1 Tax=Enterobacterales bacterium endosymbiont of Anomoneura mori TaxID=3132096 RepID=UPI00399CC019